MSRKAVASARTSLSDGAAYRDQREISTEEETGGYGFLVSISGKKMTIACSVPSLFAETYSEFMNEVFLSGAESVSLPDGYSWSRDVTKLYYSDFGACRLS